MRKSKLEELREYVEELKTIKAISSESINNGYITSKRGQFLLNNGKIVTWDEMLKNKKVGNASIVLPMTQDNNVVLVVQPRVYTRRTVGIELPAGYIEEGEEPIIAASRELTEETGYVSNNILEISHHYQDQGCSRAINHSFVAFDCEKKKDQSLDPDEIIRYFECTYGEALELMDMDYIEDANSIITLERSKEHVKRRR
jgi:ADP-ribose pyrophosphatase